MLVLIVRFLLAGLQTRRTLVLENLALRHQVYVLRRRESCPRPTDRARALWVTLSRIWSGWRRPLMIARAETVVRWHRCPYQLPHPPTVSWIPVVFNAWVVTMLALIVRSLLAGLQAHRSLVLEILALRHQVEVPKRGAKRPPITIRERALGVILSRIWSDWRRPATTQPRRT